MSLLFVNGTLMRGLALHPNLDGATFLGERTTAPVYRLFSIGDVHPGMYRDESAGASVAGELYEVPADVLERVIAGEPPGLCVDAIELSDGTWVPGVLCRVERTDGHLEITSFGGWRGYLAG